MKIGDKFRKEFKALCEEYVANVDAYLQSNIGKCVKCTAYKHPMDGFVLKGYRHCIRRDSGVTIVGRRYQPLWFNVDWTLTFENPQTGKTDVWSCIEETVDVVDFV